MVAQQAPTSASRRRSQRAPGRSASTYGWRNERALRRVAARRAAPGRRCARARSLGQGVEQAGLADPALPVEQHEVARSGRRSTAERHGRGGAASWRRRGRRARPAALRPAARQRPSRPGRPGLAQERRGAGRLDGAVRVDAELVAQRPRQRVVRRQRRRDLSVGRERPHQVAHGPLVVGVAAPRRPMPPGPPAPGRPRRARPPAGARVATQRVGLAAHLEDPVVVVLVRQRRAGCRAGPGLRRPRLGQGALAGGAPGRRPARTSRRRLVQVQRPRRPPGRSAPDRPTTHVRCRPHAAAG